jgi:hypothetical protein
MVSPGHPTREPTLHAVGDGPALDRLGPRVAKLEGKTAVLVTLLHPHRLALVGEETRMAAPRQDDDRFTATRKPKRVRAGTVSHEVARLTKVVSDLELRVVTLENAFKAQTGMSANEAVDAVGRKG